MLISFDIVSQFCIPHCFSAHRFDLSLTVCSLHGPIFGDVCTVRYPEPWQGHVRAAEREIGHSGGPLLPNIDRIIDAYGCEWLWVLCILIMPCTCQWIIQGPHFLMIIYTVIMFQVESNFSRDRLWRIPPGGELSAPCTARGTVGWFHQWWHGGKPEVHGKACKYFKKMSNSAWNAWN